MIAAADPPSGILDALDLGDPPSRSGRRLGEDDGPARLFEGRG